VWLVAEAKRQGLTPLVKPVIQSIINVALFVSPSLVEAVLKSAGE
jgi:predicted nucleic acid-binding protein